MSTSGGYHDACGGYHEYIGGIWPKVLYAILMSQHENSHSTCHTRELPVIGFLIIIHVRKIKLFVDKLA